MVAPGGVGGMSSTRVINTVVALVLAVLAAWAVMSLLRDDEGTTDGPVIAAKEWNGNDLAEVSGVLRLEQGCLMLDDWLVFWPSETSWDDEQQAVVFGGDFDDAPVVEVGERFEGFGGYYESRRALSDVDDLVGEEAGEALTRCLHETAVRRVIAAHPSID